MKSTLFSFVTILWFIITSFWPLFLEACPNPSMSLRVSPSVTD